MLTFTIIIQSIGTVLGPHIDHGGFMSARHVSGDHDLIFMVFSLC